MKLCGKNATEGAAVKKRSFDKQFFKKIWSSLEKKPVDETGINFYQICDNVELSLNFVDKDGYITWANKEAISSGMIPEDFIGRNLQDLKKHKIILDPGALKVLQTGKKNVGEVVQYSGRTFLSITAPVKDDASKIDGVIALTLDIAEVYEFIVKSSTRALNASSRTGEAADISINKDELVCESETMNEIMAHVRKIAPASCPVLILGESGTGKEVMARHIHAMSSRSKNRLLAINCGAIPADLMEAELFGYEKGAFTGAWHAKKGLLEEASEGTILLDEIGDLDIQLQVKLLRVLQDGTFRRIGGREELKTNARILAATNKNLSSLISNGKFRADLFYRLNVFNLTLPPLRERKEDLKKLIPFFLEKYNRIYGTSRYLSREAWTLLIQNDWPGNIRELANTIERLTLLANNERIEAQDVRKHLENTETIPPKELIAQDYASLSLQKALEKLEKTILENARHKYGSCREMAKSLGIEFSTVARKLKKYGLE